MPKGAIPIRHVRFRTDGSQKGYWVSRPNEALDAYPAREAGAPTGYDIWLTPDRMTFRFDSFNGGKFVVTKNIPTHNVFSYEELDQGV